MKVILLCLFTFALKRIEVGLAIGNAKVYIRRLGLGIIVICPDLGNVYVLFFAMYVLYIYHKNYPYRLYV